MKETQHVEWKQTWRDDHLRSVCGFANAEGGVLVIGLDDQGQVVGVAGAARLLEELPNKIRDLLGIVVDVNLRSEDGREAVEVVIPAYPSPISYRGHYYQRSGSTLQELKGAALDRFLLRRQGRTWDGVPVPGVTARDLSGAALRRFRILARNSGRVEPGILREPVSSLLDKLRLREGPLLKRAALLLFHKDPERFVSGAFVKIGFFRTESDLAYHDEVHGDLFAQVATTIDILAAKYLKAAIRYEGIQRVESFPVPDAALREAVLNALVHRDYAVAAPIQIRVYEDRLKIWNPAVLPEGWNLADLLREHASVPYNPNLANAFFRAGEIEAWGRGIQRIFAACKEAGAPKPRILFEAGLWTEFPFSKAYLELIHGKAQRAAGQAAGPAIPEVSSAQPESQPESRPESQPESQPESLAQRVMSLLAGSARSKAEIAAGLGHKHVSGHLNKVIRLLLQEGFVTYTLPDKPESRLQKYALTERGMTRLEAQRTGRDLP